VNASSPEVVKFSSLGVVNSSAPTKQREQKKDFDVDVIAQDLQNFGITQSAATQLTQYYPTVYIREKVAMAQGLVTAGSCLVSQNPAGWLRKAIEEDYSLPKSSARYRQRSGREKKHARRAQGELRAMPEVAGEQRMTKEQPQQAQNAPTERREPEKTSRENETVWNKALEQVKKDLPPFDTGETAAQLTGTTLIEVTETAATIFVPNRFIIPWLERRLYSQIAKAMKTVIGKDLDLQFIAVS
jgi:hypothetical protein